MDNRDALPRLSDFVSSLLTQVESRSESVDVGLDGGREQHTLYVDTLKVDLPFELELAQDNRAHKPLAIDQGKVGLTQEPSRSKLQLRASPPTQYTETTVMPVFHRIRLTMAVMENDSEQD